MGSLLSATQTLLERTDYTLDVTTGQRKYGGPPPESVYTGPQPTIGTEVMACSAERHNIASHTVSLRPNLTAASFPLI